MAIIDLGKVSITWRGTYAGGTAYTPKDAVVYNNASYICIANTTGNLPTDTTYWNVMAAKGVDGTNVGTTITTQGVSARLCEHWKDFSRKWMCIHFQSYFHFQSSTVVPLNGGLNVDEALPVIAKTRSVT